MNHDHAAPPEAEEGGNKPKSPGMIFHIPDTKQSEEDVRLYERIFREAPQGDDSPDVLEFPWHGGRMRIRVRFFAITGGIGFLLKGFPITFLETSEKAKHSLQHTHDFLDKRNANDGVPYPAAEFSFAAERRKAAQMEAKLKAREHEESERVKEAAKLENLLDLPEQAFYDVGFIVTRLKDAGINVTPRAVEKRLPYRSTDEHPLKQNWKGQKRKFNKQEAQRLLRHYGEQGQRRAN